MQAEEILATTPTRLFPGGPDKVKARFRELAAAWHPDHCADPKAAEVFQHILRCRNAVLAAPEGKLRMQFTRTSPAAGEARQFTLEALHGSTFESGKILVSLSNVSYLVERDPLKLVPQAMKRRWEFFDGKMQHEISKYLPQHNKSVETTEGFLTVYRREPDQILLSDLLRWQGGKLEPAHVMWVVSSLLNLCSYFEVAKVAHCAILPHYVLLNLEQHRASLTGPPLYATPWGHRPVAVPKEVLGAYPSLAVKSNVVADSRLDLTLVRKLAMNALGHTNPALVANDKNLHPGLRQWLTTPAPASAVEDYVNWEKLRGKRRFTQYPATASEVYVALAA